MIRFSFVAMLPALLILAIGGVDIIARDAKTDRSERAERATIGLVDNQSLTADLLDETLAIRTRYGVLEIPASDLVKVRLAPRISESSKTRLATLLAKISSEKDDSGLSAEVLGEIHEIGTVGGYALIEAAKESADKSRQDDIAAVLNQIRKDGSAYLGPDDEIVAKRFTVRGTIETKTFRFRCLAREMKIPRSDVLHITYRELDFRKLFKVLPQHMEQQGWLVTGVELKKGQKFSLDPSGTMTYDGQSFGPTGLSNHRWNSRNVGCLQWRIGNGSWKVLSSKFEGKADMKGPLHLSVHLYQATGGGEFKITYTTKLK